MVATEPRRIEPISLSAKPFCRGDCAEVANLVCPLPQGGQRGVAGWAPADRFGPRAGPRNGCPPSRRTYRPRWLKVGRGHVRNGSIHVTAQKTTTALTIPIATELETAINAAAPSEHMVSPVRRETRAAMEVYLASVIQVDRHPFSV